MRPRRICCERSSRSPCAATNHPRRSPSGRNGARSWPSPSPPPPATPSSPNTATTPTPPAAPTSTPWPPNSNSAVPSAPISAHKTPPTPCTPSSPTPPSTSASPPNAAGHKPATPTSSPTPSKPPSVPPDRPAHVQPSTDRQRSRAPPSHTRFGHNHSRGATGRRVVPASSASAVVRARPDDRSQVVRDERRLGTDRDARSSRIANGEPEPPPPTDAGRDRAKSRSTVVSRAPGSSPSGGSPRDVLLRGCDLAELVGGGEEGS